MPSTSRACRPWQNIPKTSRDVTRQSARRARDTGKSRLPKDAVPEMELDWDRRADKDTMLVVCERSSLPGEGPTRPCVWLSLC